MTSNPVPRCMSPLFICGQIVVFSSMQKAAGGWQGWVAGCSRSAPENPRPGVVCSVYGPKPYTDEFSESGWACECASGPNPEQFATSSQHSPQDPFLWSRLLGWHLQFLFLEIQLKPQMIYYFLTFLRCFWILILLNPWPRIERSVANDCWWGGGPNEGPWAHLWAW